MLLDLLGGVVREQQDQVVELVGERLEALVAAGGERELAPLVLGRRAQPVAAMPHEDRPHRAPVDRREEVERAGVELEPEGVALQHQAADRHRPAVRPRRAQGGIGGVGGRRGGEGEQQKQSAERPGKKTAHDTTSLREFLPASIRAKFGKCLSETSEVFLQRESMARTRPKARLEPMVGYSSPPSDPYGAQNQADTDPELPEPREGGGDLEPFTALVGPNGAGKSNFIDALAFIKECLAQSIETAWERRGGSSIPTRQRGEPATLGLRVLIDLAAGSTADYAFEILAEDFDFAVARESCVIRDRNGGSSGFRVANGKFVQEIPGICPRISADRLALFAASALDEFRPLYDFLTSVQYYSVEPAQLRGWQKMDSGDVLKADGSNAAAVLNHLEQLGTRSQDERYKRIGRLLATVVPGIQAISPASDGTGREAMIEFLQGKSEKKGRRLSRLWEMSDGTLRILGLLLAIYQPQAPSVLLIEEPEATIHPAAVEVVTQILLDAAQERQVLITTHSPDILDFKEIRDDQIRVVTMERGRTIIAPMSRASRQAVREHLYTPGELLESWRVEPEGYRSRSERIPGFGSIQRSFDLIRDQDHPSYR